MNNTANKDGAGEKAGAGAVSAKSSQGSFFEE